MKKKYVMPFLRTIEADSEDMICSISMISNKNADPEGEVLSRRDNGWGRDKSVWDEEE